MTLEQILTADDVETSINEHLDYILEEIPELRFEINFDQHHPHHHLDVWKHTLLAISLSNNDFTTRLSLLLHDIGKPFSYQDEYINETEYIRHFHGHPEVSETLSRIILNRLGYEEEFIDKICYLIKNHDTKITEEDITNNLELTLIRLHIQECDSKAHNPLYQEKRLQYIEESHNTIQKLAKKQ